MTTFSFCEAVTAGPRSPEHIRLVGPEGIKPGGGVPNLALCDFDVRRGWDLPNHVVDAKTVDLHSTPRPGDGHVFLCRRCANVWRAIT